MGTFKNSAVKSMVVMRKAFRTIDAKVSESYKDHELTPTQFAVLDVLYAKGDLKIGELINSMLATSGNMTVVINNMEKKGWVQRIMCPHDKRSFIVSLTDDGKAVIEKALPEHIGKVEDIFSVLTEAEQKELIKLLKKFKNA
ncbi:MarR family winged helix-turn-helix transcriptional regulator [Streptococcus porcinus]|uniref:MarR family transcriptional regulator n=2 Tax=Streptococcus porcinus TaxID=1340 RepID=A0A4V6L2Z6_STRPO|nr:MarR family transcriptional regulator [Streptococcus porcinus]EGJ28025.1 transcriptional regulator, MarR family [Streptococcus porcinus str. Jelinkova 176]MBA2796293.1 MarR family transcriptional regulator [Streptococcus porcinus]SQG42797.1 MarR family transcriptional regulator [Streptococcus porcinus]VTS17667.1 MarR family transcriptional regulator [Streptococcus porcinus]VTT41809.1 MarR family transcriptional regulator [Streptococcus porcinus]